MKFKYVGERGSISLYGFDFEHGKPVEVPDDKVAYQTQKRRDMYARDKDVVTVMVVDKLRANHEFEEVKVGRPAAK